MKHFFTLARFKMATPVDEVDGGVIIPAGIATPTLVRRDLDKKFPHLKRRILDPQIYLSRLNASLCTKACINLMSYGWFGNHAIAQYDSHKFTQKEWKSDVTDEVLKTWKGAAPTKDDDIATSITTCLSLQATLGCEMVILPAPLIMEARDVATALQWIDRGTQLAKELKISTPLLATVAVSDTCLRGFDPWSNSILDNILDQVTARSVHGAYIALEQTSEDGYYYTHPNTVGSLLRLVSGCKAGGLQHVHTAFAGVAGLLALIAGCDTWSSGWYRAERRLKLQDFEKQDGRAYPAYYSHSLATEFHLESDLDKAVKAKLLDKIADSSPASVGLLRALSSGNKVSAVPEWQYRQANVRSATEHFVSAMVRETKKLSMMSPEQQIQYGKNWLTTAVQLAKSVSRLGDINSRTALAHQQTWLQAFETYLSNV